MAGNSVAMMSSFLKTTVLLVAVLWMLLALLPSRTTALPFKDIVSKAMDEAQEPHRRAKRDVSEVTCQQPTNILTMFQDLNANIDATKFIRPAKNGKAIAATSGVTWIVDPNENKTCPNTYSRIDSAPLSHRSLCPFYFDILQLPQGYYPPTLQYARCKCQQCIENSALSCVPIVTPLTVLKPNGCSQGLQLYVEEKINIQTACTCAFKGTVVDAGVLPPNFSTSTAATTTTTLSWGQE